MTKEEALNIAIDYMNERLEEHDAKFQRHPVAEAERNNILADIEAVKEALAQPEQEPDYYGLTADHLWMSISKDHYDRLKPEYRMTCYTTPPQRKPLTNEEIDEISKKHIAEGTRSFEVFARAIEAAHGIKDET